MKLASPLLLIAASLGTVNADNVPANNAAPTPAPTNRANVCRKITSYTCTDGTEVASYFFPDRKLQCDADLTNPTELPRFVAQYDSLCFFDGLACTCQAAGDFVTNVPGMGMGCIKDPTNDIVRVVRQVSNITTTQFAGTCNGSVSPDDKFTFVCKSPKPALCNPTRRLESEGAEEVTPIEQAEFEAQFFEEYGEEDVEDEPEDAAELPDMSWLTQNSVIGQGNSLRAFTENCGEYEYNGMLQVHEGHLFAVGLPKEDAIEAGCPTIASHSVIDTEDAYVAPQKEFIVWQGYHETPSQMTEGALSLGSFKLAELTRAYEEARVSKQGKGTYDILKNNCASFMLEIAAGLGVNVDARVTGYVTRRLIEQKSKDLADKIRASVNFSSIFGERNLRADGDALSDEALVEMVVKTQVNEL